MSNPSLHRQNVVACIWDFDKTLIPGYMQGPIFAHYGVHEERFWEEVNSMAAIYRQRGYRVSEDILYLNHLLTYVRHGRMPGLNNALLRQLGASLRFYQGMPEFLKVTKDMVSREPAYAKYELRLEHYVVSTGLAEMVRGSVAAPFLDGVYGCEFIEHPLPPQFLEQEEMPLEGPAEIAQIGTMVDNTIKTRFIFEINKGSNKIPSIDVNAKMQAQDRRVPIRNMIYVADGPSDVPVFSVVRKNGGRTFAVYEPGNEKEFAQNDEMRACGRVDHFGRADYREKSDTYMWLFTHIRKICDRIVEDIEETLSQRVGRPPRHIREERPPLSKPATEQSEIFQG